MLRFTRVYKSTTYRDHLYKNPILITWVVQVSTRLFLCEYKSMLIDANYLITHRIPLIFIIESYVYCIFCLLYYKLHYATNLFYRDSVFLIINARFHIKR